MEEVLDFWFDPAVRPRWFRSTPEFDRQITDRFLPTHRAAEAGQLDHWATGPEGVLALVIVLDQFPLNMFRGRGQSFATEGRARDLAVAAIDRGWDRSLDAEQQLFLYMPLMHREDLADQDRAVALFEAAGLEDGLKWARHHRDIVRRFGRFPHRNAILGRTDTAAEREYLASEEAFRG